MTTEIGKWLDAQRQVKSCLGRGAQATMDSKTLEQLIDLAACFFFCSTVDLRHQPQPRN
jgi:hypothetical protein